MRRRQRLAVHADRQQRVAPVHDDRGRGADRHAVADRLRTLSASGRTPASSSRSAQRRAQPARVADVRPADLVGDAGEGDVALDQVAGEQVVEVSRSSRSTMPWMRSAQSSVRDLRARPGRCRSGRSRRSASEGRAAPRTARSVPRGSGVGRRYRRRQPHRRARLAVTPSRRRVTSRPNVPATTATDPAAERRPTRNLATVSSASGTSGSCSRERAQHEGQQRDRAGDRAGHRGQQVEEPSLRPGRGGRGADQPEDGDAGQPADASRTASAPVTSGQQREDADHRADQDRLVVGAERGDRPLLEPPRRRVDDAAADGDDR